MPGIGDIVNGLAIVGVLALGTVGALTVGPRATVEEPDLGTEAPIDLDATELTDATGLTMAVEERPRLLSMCTTSDRVLLELVPPERIVGITEYTRERPQGFRYPPGGSMRGDTSIEDLLALEADLVFVCSAGGRIDRVERAREAGITVFDLGGQHGLETLPRQIEAIGVLVGEPERARLLRDRWLHSFRQVSADIPQEDRPEGLYLSVYGESFYGGTRGSSYWDLLTAAGIVDLAAEHGFEGWPAYEAEMLLSLDPSLVITRTGGRSAICGHAQLESLAACTPPGRVVELDGAALGDPGLGMLETAQDLRRLVHR